MSLRYNLQATGQGITGAAQSSLLAMRSVLEEIQMKLVGLAVRLFPPQQNNNIHITIVIIISTVIQLSRAIASRALHS